MKKYVSPKLKFKLLLDKDVMGASYPREPELDDNDTPWDIWEIN